MSKKITYNMICPYCDKRCTTGVDEHTVTKRKTKQYFHRNCYESNTKRNKNEEL